MHAKSRLLQKPTVKLLVRRAGNSLFDITTVVLVLVISLIGYVCLHIPAALTVVQLVLGVISVRLLLVQNTRLRVTRYTFWQAAFAAITIYASYLFFFLRHYFSPRFLTSQNPITLRATTVALAVLIICQVISFGLAMPKKVRPLRIALLFALLLAITYVPVLQRLCLTRNLSLLDWFCVAMAGIFYLALCLLQQFTRAHSRREVLEIHKSSLAAKP